MSGRAGIPAEDNGWSEQDSLQQYNGEPLLR